MLSILKTWVYGFTGIATVMSFMPFAAMLVFLAPFYEISPIQIHFIVKGTKAEEEDDDNETIKSTPSSTSSSEESSDRPSETS